MKWTLEQLDSLETEILKLHLHTKLSDTTLADCMGKIDTERYKLNQANGVTTGDELVLPIQSVVKVERSETAVNCVLCGEPLTSSEQLNDANCCDLCWLSN